MISKKGELYFINYNSCSFEGLLTLKDKSPKSIVHNFALSLYLIETFDSVLVVDDSKFKILFEIQRENLLSYDLRYDGKIFILREKNLAQIRDIYDPNYLQELDLTLFQSVIYSFN